MGGGVGQCDGEIGHAATDHGGEGGASRAETPGVPIEYTSVRACGSGGTLFTTAALAVGNCQARGDNARGVLGASWEADCAGAVLLLCGESCTVTAGHVFGGGQVARGGHVEGGRKGNCRQGEGEELEDATEGALAREVDSELRAAAFSSSELAAEGREGTR